MMAWCGKNLCRGRSPRVCVASEGRAVDTGPGTQEPKGGAVGLLSWLGATWGVRQGNHGVG